MATPTLTGSPSIQIGHSFGVRVPCFLAFRGVLLTLVFERICVHKSHQSSSIGREGGEQGGENRDDDIHNPLDCLLLLFGHRKPPFFSIEFDKNHKNTSVRLWSSTFVLIS